MPSVEARPTLDLRGQEARRVVLVVGTDEWAIEQGAARAASAGFTVARCHEPGEAPFPCNALRAGRGCPLVAGVDAVLDVRSRVTGTPPVHELGALCGLRAGVMVVGAGPAGHDGYGPWADTVAEPTDRIGDVLERAFDLEHRVQP